AVSGALGRERPTASVSLVWPRVVTAMPTAAIAIPTDAIVSHGVNRRGGGRCGPAPRCAAPDATGAASDAVAIGGPAVLPRTLDAALSSRRISSAIALVSADGDSS